MKFAYKFCNLLGTVYRKGNLLFTPDGNSVISPVGNRITIFDLKSNKSETLPIESTLNFTAIAQSPDSNLIIAVNEDGDAALISLISRSVLHQYKFHRRVHAISFSPDGKKFAVTKENTVLVFHAPGRTKDFNPFVLYKIFYGSYDENVCIDWTSDSRAFCVGSKDMNTRVYGAERFNNLIIYSLGGHRDTIIASFFENNSLDLYSLSQNGQLCVWECDTEPEDLQPYVEGDGTELTGENKLEDKESEEKKESKILYKKVASHNFKAARGEGAPFAKLTAAAFHKPTHILVTGFQDGAFFLHEMPEFNLIHSLSISDQTITSIAFNKMGDWLALGCSGHGQLLVWEWQSESFVLKQQGHFNNMNSLSYSPDGQYIATGGEDGKVKVWNTTNGFCFVTFAEHSGGVTDVAFNQNGQVVLSCSLDGTVRAFDLNRYRNFRTFASPRPAQFSCLAIDASGEVICAGGRDVFEIFVWSMKTGRLLDVLAGHEGPISKLSFSPSNAVLASASWDKTVKLWDVFENKGATSTLQLGSDVLAVVMRPDGKEVAISTLNGNITFWEVENATQTGSIEGRRDLGYSRKEADKMTAKTSAAVKSFNALCYTADGKCILAGGRSKNVCIYSVEDQLLLKRFEISCNLSFDGTEEFLDRRKMTEFGSLALVDEGQGDSEGQALSLPGVRRGDMSSRHWKPEVLISSLQFSPTGRAWAATTTEGLLLYSLDHNLMFDPFELDIDVTPESVRSTLTNKQYTTALMLAFRLNEQYLIQEVLEQIPVHDITFICSSLPNDYVDKMLVYVASQIETSRHVDFYMTWCQNLLMQNGSKLKQRSQMVMPTLRMLQKNITKKFDDLGKICDYNKYGLEYILSLSRLKKKRQSEHLLIGQSDSDSQDFEVDLV